MTVSSSASTAEFPGNGVTTVFPLPFRFFSNGDISAQLVNDSTGHVEQLSLGINYTLFGAGEPEVDGNPVSALTMLVAPPSGFTLAVERDMAAVQETDIINQARFYPEIHENVFDRIVMLIQQGLSGISRALVRPFGKNYYDAESRQIKNLADPTALQDATTLASVQAYVGSVISQIQGPINNSANVLYVNGDGFPDTVQNGILRQFTSVYRMFGKTGAMGGEKAFLQGYYPESDDGGGIFKWSPTTPKSQHNGGSIISPTVPWTGSKSTHVAFVDQVGETDPGGLGCWVRVTSEFTTAMFGAVGGPTGNSASNMKAWRMMIAVASAMGVAAGSSFKCRSARHTFGDYKAGGPMFGTYQVLVMPAPRVRLTIESGIVLDSGLNAAATSIGYSFLGPVDDSQPATDYFTVKGEDDAFIDMNAAGNLNTTFRRNPAITLLKGDRMEVSNIEIKNCPGYQCMRIGLDVVPFSIGPFKSHDVTFTNVGETVPGNAGISDHSSLYCFGTIEARRIKGNNPGNPATICTLIEAHGDGSVIDDCEYNNYLNLVNIGGYASNANTFAITNNRCYNGHMLVRAYTNGIFTIKNVLLSDNQLRTGVGKFGMVDFGVATLAMTVRSVDHIGNTYDFDGVDHGVGYPMAVWIRGCLNFNSSDNTYRGILGPGINIGDCPAGAVVTISDRFLNVNQSGYAASQAAIFQENNTGKYSLIQVSNATFVSPKSFAYQTSAFVPSAAFVLSFKGNTAVGVPNLINIENSADIGRTDFAHIGQGPLQAFEVGNQWRKFSVGSTWVCTDKNWTMRKTVPDSTYWNKFGDGSAFPVVGIFQKGDKWHNTLPNAAGYSDWDCVTGGLDTAAVWKQSGAIAA